MMDNLGRIIVIIGVLFIPHNVFAYIGPGAGFAAFSSILSFILPFLLALLAFLIKPIKKLYLLLKIKMPSTSLRWAFISGSLLFILLFLFVVNYYTGGIAIEK